MSYQSKFRVTLRSERPVSGGVPEGANPFKIHALSFRKVKHKIRVWEFHAADEHEVRRLYQEAKDADFDNVRGFEISLIERIG